MASSSTSVKTYDVFISFRGTDTRKGITSFLYDALCDKGIKVFIDEEDLNKGDEISPVLLKAIKASAISIIVFSKNYAQSRWCLDELNHIVRCMKEDEQRVLPVFYKVKPTNIRKQKKSFEDAFSEHETRFGRDSEKLKMWRESLATAANLSGFNSADARSESEMIKQIVESVMEKLKEIPYTSSYDTKGLVGIESVLQKIEPSLCIDSTNRDTRVIGIWGMGGIGKTTLARVLFKKFYSRFSGFYFFENVREEVTKHQSSDLQKRVFSELLKEKDLKHVTSRDEDRLRHRNILLVLDDVDNVNPLDVLPIDRECFGPGSRIVVTSRNSHVLKVIKADAIHEIEDLSFRDALRLFLSKAFDKGDETPAKGYLELAETIVKKYGKGNPLALTVLGRYLYSRSIEEWESKMESLDSTPNHDVQDILKVSYDGLSPNLKEIFLDIACFFKGKGRNKTQKILGYRYPGVVGEIKDLRDKALITVNEFDTIWMHDLIEEMGQEIVRRESNDLGERSRLWSTSDISHVLENNRGTQKIQGIDFRLISDKLTISPLVFKQMRNLWFLSIYTHERKLEDLDFLPATLIYFKWMNCPLTCLPESFNPKNLCEVLIQGDKLERVWSRKYKDLQKLEALHLCRCINLSQLPDLSHASNLKYLDLRWCINLSQLPDLSCNSNLEYLDLTWCINLSQLPDLSRNSNLKKLVLINCNNLSQLPDLSRNSNLKKLVLIYCNNLSQLPDLSRNSNLEYLDLINCSNLIQLPDLSRNSNLEYLDLTNNGKSSQLPDLSLNSNLKELNLTNCSNLIQLPDLSRNSNLEKLNLTNCSKLSQLPDLSRNSNLEKLNLTNCSNLIQLPDLSRNSNLKELNLTNCNNLIQLPDLSRNSNLKELNLTNCSKLSQLPDLSRNSNLTNCSNLNQLSDISLH